jgi:site-specific DNA-methyltransferase (adenine-specific)
MGSGTTAIASLKSERKYVGFETDIEYIKLAERRLNSIKSQMKLL